MKKNKMEIFLFGIFGVVGIGLLIGGLFWLLSAMQFKAKAVEVEGTITEITKHRDADGDISHTVYVTYTYDGEEYEDVSLGYYSSGMRKGADIKLYCDPDNPGHIRAQGSDLFGAIMIFGMGVIFALVGIIPICIIIKKDARRKNLLQNGRALYAEVEQVEVNYSYSVNHRHPYILYCHYVDPYSNVMYRFKSDNLWTDPTPFFPQGSEVQVLVKEGDYSVYHVNVEKAMEGRVVDYT